MDEFLALLTADHKTHQLSPGVMFSKLNDGRMYCSVQIFPGAKRTIVAKGMGATGDEAFGAAVAVYVNEYRKLAGLA